MKLLKTYLKPFAALVLACILLLFGQAMCDLTLPNVMSDIAAFSLAVWMRLHLRF